MRSTAARSEMERRTSRVVASMVSVAGAFRSGAGARGSVGGGAASLAGGVLGARPVSAGLRVGRAAHFRATPRHGGRRGRPSTPPRGGVPPGCDWFWGHAGGGPTNHRRPRDHRDPDPCDAHGVRRGQAGLWSVGVGGGPPCPRAARGSKTVAGPRGATTHCGALIDDRWGPAAPSDEASVCWVRRGLLDETGGPPGERRRVSAPVRPLLGGLPCPRPTMNTPRCCTIPGRRGGSPPARGGPRPDRCRRGPGRGQLAYRCRSP